MVLTFVARLPAHRIAGLCVLATTMLVACVQVEITATPEIENASEPIQVTALPTLTYSVASTITPAIFIENLRLEPGSGSEIISPLRLKAQIPEGTGVIRVQLLGQDGRLIARQVLPSEAGLVELELPFEPNEAAENAHLTFSMDDEFGRMQELTSIEIVLLADGENKLVAGETLDQLAIDSPSSGDTPQDGVLTVSGTVLGETGLLNVQLITRDGRVLNSHELRLTAIGVEKNTFTAELIYSLREAAWVQVAVSLRKAGITTAFKSVEVWLEP